MQAKKARRRALCGTLSTFFAEDDGPERLQPAAAEGHFVTHSWHPELGVNKGWVQVQVGPLQIIPEIAAPGLGPGRFVSKRELASGLPDGNLYRPDVKRAGNQPNPHHYFIGREENHDGSCQRGPSME